MGMGHALKITKINMKTGRLGFLYISALNVDVKLKKMEVALIWIAQFANIHGVGRVDFKLIILFIKFLLVLTLILVTMKKIFAKL